jgi:NAD(P)-dependent dehydrogenase (short-subunit alcohol dehydrogenase family)
MHALVASPYKSAYNAAKHGVAGFTKTVALEVATKNITVNAICPGYTDTDLVRNQAGRRARAAATRASLQCLRSERCMQTPSVPPTFASPDQRHSPHPGHPRRKGTGRVLLT